jgi:pimeloyl-ACP methyl ester carboxylesterase
VRKHLFYLLIAVVLPLYGCSGGGNGGKSDGSIPADTRSTVAAVGVGGGSALLGDNAKVTFSSFALSSLANIVFEKQGSDPGPIQGSRAISSTYQLTIPAGKIASLSYLQSLISDILNSLLHFDLNSNFIKIEIPLDAALLDSSTANAYRYVGVNIDNGATVTQQAGIFSMVDGKVRLSLPPLSFGTSQQKIRATVYSLDSIPSILQQALPADISLYRVNSAVDIIKAQAAAPGSKTPLILIHGIQLLDVLAPGNITSLSNAYKETWSVFFSEFFASAELQNRYDLYTFRYNTFDSIAANSIRLKNEIARVLGPSPQVTIVAHSMGGLIANDFIINGGNSNLQRLITLGTPFHGSQAVHYLEQLMPAPLEIFISLYNNGALSGGAMDLHWDGSDGNYVESDKYLAINRARMNSLPAEILAKYHVIAGLNPESTLQVKSFADFFTRYESLNNHITYNNDGIVASRSALFSIFNNGAWSDIPRSGITVATFPGLNHVQLHDNLAVLDHVKGILLSN